MLKKIFLLFVSFTIISNLVFPVVAIDLCEDNQNSSSVMDILDNYHTASNCAQISSISSVMTTSFSDKTMDEIREETVSSLASLGCDAYDVNPNTYKSIESTLNTDLSVVCPDPYGSYIVLVGVDPLNNISPTSSIGGTAGSSFEYTYNGTTYTMRYLTVTAADNPYYSKASYVDLLDSSSSSVILACLDTLICTLVDEYLYNLGTVSQICGLILSNFKPETRATLTMYGATNWTRVYTQIWDSYNEDWVFASCVEYVNMASYMGGQYYDADTNQYEAVPSSTKRSSAMSNNYTNSTWRKENAVLGYLTNDTIFDLTGAVTYTYGGETVITHAENFGW